MIPVGYDAYRLWERWPQQRIGARAYMRSTYDRTGGNEGADASHFLYQLAEDKNVTLDLQGPGILYFARYNHWHGSPWHYEVDGVDHLVQETSSATPDRPAADSVFLPQTVFPNPMAWTWSATRGADLSWVPIPFEKSFRMAYSRTHYGTGYYIYHQYVPGARLSQRIRSWTERDAPPADIRALIARAGTDLVPRLNSPEGKRLELKQRDAELSLAAKTSALVTELTEAPSVVRALEFSVPREQAIDFGQTWLRVNWDGSQHLSIDAPLALFFAAGTFYNRNGREFLVKAFPVNVRFEEQRLDIACYFPMPFFKSARIELRNETETQFQIRWSLRYAPSHERPRDVAYFHATYRDHPRPELGRDLVLLDTRGMEGEPAWSGHLVGTSIIFSDRAVLETLEGDPRFFFDDSQTPQAQGTGTEEWNGGGDYWGGLNMTLPFAGHPTGARNLQQAKNELDKIESAYRFLLADLMPFGRNARIQLEHGGRNESTEHYQTVTYWYGSPAPTLVRSDQLKIGSPVSENEHRYSSPAASEPYSITSRYEWGVDTLDQKEIYPAETDVGRRTTGVSEFNLKLDPANFGVLLRRKLDFQFPNQCAEIFVADARDGKPAGKFKPAGIWYLAGGNSCIYSNPTAELGPTQHIIQTSNRRFRDDEFLIGRDLTRNRSEIRVRVKFVPVTLPLFPGQALPELAWTELRYDAYCFVLPGKTPHGRP